MRPFPVRNLSLAVIVVLSLAACNDSQSTTTPTPVDPTIVTDTFSGTLSKNGAVTHSFVTASGCATSSPGCVTVTATTLDPADATIGLALGTWNGVACQIVIANDNAVQGTVVTGTVAAVGTLCARIYDAVGTLAADTTYTLTVAHP